MAKSKGISVSLEPTPKAAEAISLLATAQGIAVTDKTSHEAALRFRKDANAMQKEILAYYKAMKDPLNQARNVILDFEKQHTEPLARAIALVDARITGYVREQERIEREAAAAAQREAEAREQARRDAEAAEAEAAALKLEASSNVLSEREQTFVSLFTASPIRSIEAALKCAKRAGYKDPAATIDRFLEPDSKIHTAIAHIDKAAAIRRESEAKQAAPIVVEAVAVDSEIAKVAGVSQRTYYACGDVDLKALILAVAEDIKSGDGTKIQALQANMPFLNAEARSLKEMFPRVYTACQLSKREGIAG